MFLKGECAETEVSLFGGKQAGERKFSPYSLRVGPGCAGEAVYVKLERLGAIYKSPYKSLKKRLHVAIQVRRKQFRVFLNGKRLTMVPFSIKGNVNSVGFFLNGKYKELISNIRIAKYSSAETKPSPEKFGIKVEKSAEGMKLTVPERILFDFNRYTLKPEAKKALDVVADMIRENGAQKIVVTGYTDNVGSATYNLRLSLQRAQSVADYLMYCEKIDPGRFKVVGKGEADPIADNGTEAGRARNRRVEIRLVK